MVWRLIEAGAAIVSAGEQRFGFGREGAEPFSAEPMAKDVGQEQGPALFLGPLLRNGVEAAQGVADVGDGFDDQLPLFVLQADFDRPLAPMPNQASHAAQERGPAGDRFPVMVGVASLVRAVAPPVMVTGGGTQLAAAMEAESASSR